MAIAKTRSAGFSLIELIIGVVIVGILAALAMPSLQQMLINNNVRNAAESIVSGIQRARAEAVARNTDVRFTLASSTSWTVDYVVKPVPSAPAIDSSSGNEISSKVTVVAVAKDLSTPATVVTFDNLGQVKDPDTDIRQVDFSAAGATQNLRITMGAGGNAPKMCDPSLAAGSSPRACS